MYPRWGHRRRAALSLARPDAGLGAALSNRRRSSSSFIDWMALHKLNVLHWHLTDDQAWRLEIKKYPKLTEVGAWRVPAGAGAARGHRSRDRQAAQVRRLLHAGSGARHRRVRRRSTHHDRARDRNARSRERPDRCVSAARCRGQAVRRRYPRIGASIRICYNVDDSTFAFLEDVLAEVIALFPSEYIHVGGDEAVKDAVEGVAEGPGADAGARRRG